MSFLSHASLLASFIHASISYLAPVTVAQSPAPVVSLPQEANFAQSITQNLIQYDYTATSHLRSGQVAADIDANLQLFLESDTDCLVLEDLVTYQVTLRNTGAEPISDLVLNLRYSADTYEFVGVTPAVSESEAGSLTWFLERDLLPGHIARQVFQIGLGVIDVDGDNSVLATAGNIDGQAISLDVISNDCNNQPAGLDPIPEDKQPVIICDPAEINCGGVVPFISEKFSRIFNTPELSPTICSPNDPDDCTSKLPQLGPRFAEAVADIIPGECRVLEDDIVVTPAFHDAFNRRGQMAATFIRPLYDADQNFLKSIVYRNEQLGWTNFFTTQSNLEDVHNNIWQQHLDFLNTLAEDPVNITTARTRFQSLSRTWLDQVLEAQQDLNNTYESLQERRRQSFDSVAERSVDQAKESMSRACGVPNADAGLASLLPLVKISYEQTLSDRQRIYTETQDLALENYRSILNSVSDQLFQVSNGNLTVNDIIATVEDNQSFVFDSLMSPYRSHRELDIEADHNVRIEDWGPVLDFPKAAATSCQKELDFGPQVETTFCESGGYPEFVIREAPFPAKVREIRPPVDIGGGNLANIDIQQVIGVSCGGRPGDPFWAPDCSCSCNEAVINPVDGNIRFCQFVPPAELPPLDLFDPAAGLGAIRLFERPGLAVEVPTREPLSIDLDHKLPVLDFKRDSAPAEDTVPRSEVDTIDPIQESDPIEPNQEPPSEQAPDTPTEPVPEPPSTVPGDIGFGVIPNEAPPGGPQGVTTTGEYIPLDNSGQPVDPNKRIAEIVALPSGRDVAFGITQDRQDILYLDPETNLPIVAGQQSQTLPILEPITASGRVEGAVIDLTYGAYLQVFVSSNLLPIIRHDDGRFTRDHNGNPVGADGQFGPITSQIECLLETPNHIDEAF